MLELNQHLWFTRLLSSYFSANLHEWQKTSHTVNFYFSRNHMNLSSVDPPSPSEDILVPLWSLKCLKLQIWILNLYIALTVNWLFSLLQFEYGVTLFFKALHTYFYLHFAHLLIFLKLAYDKILLDVRFLYQFTAYLIDFSLFASFSLSPHFVSPSETV